MIDPAATPGECPGDEHQSKPPAGLPLPPVPVQRAGCRNHVAQQVRRGNRGAGVPRTLTWNGSSSTAPEIPAGAASSAIENAASSATISVYPVPGIPGQRRRPAAHIDHTIIWCGPAAPSIRSDIRGQSSNQLRVSSPRP